MHIAYMPDLLRNLVDEVLTLQETKKILQLL